MVKGADGGRTEFRNESQQRQYERNEAARQQRLIDAALDKVRDIDIHTITGTTYTYTCTYTYR